MFWVLQKKIILYYTELLKLDYIFLQSSWTV